MAYREHVAGSNSQHSRRLSPITAAALPVFKEFPFKLEEYLNIAI
jgi:hypothetical protein